EQITYRLQHLDPYAFERLAQRLLRECGCSEVQVTKRSGDGGIDGTENCEYRAYSVLMWLFNVKGIKVR
ncbi:MAG: restriction endonuclease, partial [Muribaculaceae bacterium]|nr:restriction endonuclease [Muribaculaceae bacterium]